MGACYHFINYKMFLSFLQRLSTHVFVHEPGFLRAVEAVAERKDLRRAVRRDEVTVKPMVVGVDTEEWESQRDRCTSFPDLLFRPTRDLQ